MAFVSDTGVVMSIREGLATIIVTGQGLTGATPVTVAPPQAKELEFFPDSYALTPGGVTRQFMVWELLDDRTIVDHAATSHGTQYLVGNPSVASVNSAGVLTTLAPGMTDVTVIYGGQISVVPIVVRTAVTGASDVGPQGGIVANSAGIAIQIGPETFAANTRVEVTSLTEAELPLELPEVFQFENAFRLDLGADPGSEMALSIPAPVGAVTGETLYLLRASQLEVDPGVFEDRWEVVDKLVVGSDAIARTTSLPFSGMVGEGIYGLLARLTWRSLPASRHWVWNAARPWSLTRWSDDR